MQKCAQIVTRKVADHTVLLPLKPNAAGLWVYELNDTAAFLWDLIDGQNDESALCGRLVDEFAVAPEDAQRDVQEFAAAMRALGALL